jgi:hypothetical protein
MTNIPDPKVVPKAKRHKFSAIGAGNVPGTGLLITFLTQATTLTGDAPPAVVVKNLAANRSLLRWC